MTKQVQLILDEIAARYDPTIASHVWSLTQRKLAADCPEEELLPLVTLYQVMGGEGFSPSERGAIFATLLQSVTGQDLSPQAWAEILGMPVYETSSFSPVVKEELRYLSNLDPVGE